MGQVTLKNKPVKIGNEPPKLGTKISGFIGVDPHLKEYSLEDFPGRKKVICFVPSLDTPLCSLSAQKFNQQIIQYPKAVVIYCSMDLPFALKRVCMNDKEHYGHIHFLSLFRHANVAKMFGVEIEDGTLKGLCARAVFVLDETDHLTYSEIVPEITSEVNYDKTFSYL
jgi:thiol peroxidase